MLKQKTVSIYCFHNVFKLVSCLATATNGSGIGIQALVTSRFLPVNLVLQMFCQQFKTFQFVCVIGRHYAYHNFVCTESGLNGF